MKFWLSVITVLLADQISKFWIQSTMALGESHSIIQGILDITYVRNRGAAFSILEGKSWLFIVIAVIAIIVLILYNRKEKFPTGMQIAMGAIAGGSMGNVIDRWVYRAVIDFISIGWWPIFNFADMAIVGGGILLIIYLIINDKDRTWA